MRQLLTAFCVMQEAFFLERRSMGGVGSGRKAKDKSRAKVTDFKPARGKKSESEENEPKARLFSVPAHVSTIKTTSGCRFGG